MKKTSLHSSIEHLESRIAPASIVTVSLDQKSATWVDLDGDHVTLKTTKGILQEADFTFLPHQTGDAGDQLALLDLHGHGDSAKGIALTFTAVRDRVLHVGDGFVNVGRIDATGVDLGAVIIPGDLASISAGDATLTTFSIAKITVNSGGAIGLATQGATLGGTATNNEWIFTGKAGAVTVKGNLFSSIDVQNSNTTVDYDVNASLASVTIGGNLVGGDDSLRGSDGVGSGYLFAEGAIGPVKIGGGLLGGTKKFGGSVTGSSSIASISIGGSIVGGTATGTGLVFAYGLGSVTVFGSLIGGTSPSDSVTGALTSVIDSAGAIGSFFNIGAVKITGDVVSGVGTFSGAIYTAPASGANIKSVAIGGTLYGFDTINLTASTTQYVANGIYSDGQLGAVKIGAISGTSPSSPAQIIAHGTASPTTAASALAIASVTVARGAYSVEILAGFNSTGTADNPDVQIGAVKIAHDFIGSSISAGMTRDGGGFGNASNVLATAATGYADSALVAKIASVTIGGTVNGNPLGTADFSAGIVAQEIVAMKLGGTALELTKNFVGGSRNLFSFGNPPSFIVREIS